MDKQYCIKLDDFLEQKINHPANIKSIYKFAAKCFGIPNEELTVIVEKNFLKLFGNHIL